MAIDWLDKTREDQFSYEMIDPFNLDSSRGFMEGVITSSPSLTYGYYTDTRVSGSLEAITDDYIDYSLIRIFHDVPEWGYHNELGTFFVSNKNGAYNQAYRKNFDLVSMFGRVSDDALPSNFCIQKGNTGQNMLKQLFSTYGVTYSLPSGLNDKTYTGAVVYQIGENVLSTMYDIAGETKLRLDVNGHGVITVSNYITPSKSNTPVFEFGDDNGTINGDISENIDLFGTVNRVIVSSDKTENKNTTTVSGYADRSASSKASYNKLGRRNTAAESVTDLTPFTNATAKTKANSLLGEYEDTPTEWTFEGVYIPNGTGSIVTLRIKNVEHLAMIKNKTVKLTPGMITSYTLKEV